METIKQEIKPITPRTEATQTGSAKGRYEELKTDRQIYEERARECAKLTIPMLFREEGANSASSLKTPWQGLGARGLKVLVAKQLLAILPANSPFWRNLLDADVVAQLETKPDSRAKIEAGLAQVEREVQDYIESHAHRPKVAEMLAQLNVAGNALVFVHPAGHLRVYKLTEYVVKRDPVGNWTECIAHEAVSPKTLPPHVKELLDENVMKSKKVDVFTQVKLGDDGKYHVHQEINGKTIPGSEGFYPMDACPWIPLRLYAVDGEDYGRSYVEEYLGDLASLEVLSQAIIEGAVASARVVHMIRPGGVTKKKDLENAKNNDVISGDANDVSTHQVLKHNDINLASQVSMRIEERLQQAFLMTSSVQRNAERVTATEVQLMAQELEDVLGGIYSILAQEFQLPYLKAVVANMERKGDLYQLPKGIAKPVIVTGLGALGRGQDLTKLQTFISVMQPFGDQAFQVLNMDDYATRVATALGMDTKGLIKDPQVIAQEQQAAQMAQLGQNIAPDVVKGAMGNPELMQQMMGQASQ